jgi:hypothetical protein
MRALFLRHAAIPVLAASLLVLPCAAQTTAQPDTPVKQKPKPKKPAKAEAPKPTAMPRTEIVFYLRPVPMQELLGKNTPSWMTHDIDLLIDQKKAGKIKTFQSVAVPVAPGPHDIDYEHFSIAKSLFDLKSPPITVEQGKTTYVEITVENNVFFFTVNPEAEAKVMLARLAEYGGSR